MEALALARPRINGWPRMHASALHQKELACFDRDPLTREPVPVESNRTTPKGSGDVQRRILVTGGAGFIGSHTVDLLVARGERVRVLDALLPPVHMAGRWPPYLSSEVERVHGSVENPATLREALDDVDVVVHLAAHQDYLPNFSRFFHVNAAGTALLYELLVAEPSLRERVKRVVVATSQAVLGEGRYECPNHGVKFPGQRPLAQLEAGDWDPRCDRCDASMVTRPTFADDPARPHNQYGISKLTQELIALNLGARYGVPTVAMRYSITQGPRQSFTNPYSGALRIFVQRVLHGRQPMVYEDGQQLRDFVTVWDVARANLIAIDDPRTDYKALNVGGGHAISVLDYAQVVSRALRRPVNPELPGRFRVGDTRHITSDISTLTELGWCPEHSLEEAAAAYAEWAQAQPGFGDYTDIGLRTMTDQGVVRNKR
jgi:dTDP-L-rhamnose 4-epimerase